MSHQPQQKQSDIVKILERENVISFKKKPKITKDSIKSQNNNDDEDNISAQSSHSGVYSEDVNRFKGKINPLPELGKQKKRFITKNMLAQQIRINNYQEKQVRQQQNLMLKQKNNFLSSENMKLKTKISTLQKENVKLQKMLEQQPSKAKTPGLNIMTKQRFRPSAQNLSTKMLVKSLKKELEDMKKQNNNIKSSIKFTTISELEIQRDAILEQTNRLRIMLEQEQSKRITLKINQQGMSHLEQKIGSMQERNNILIRQNNELKSKLRTYEQGQTKANKVSENEKTLSKTLYNVRRLLKQKEKEVEQLRDQIKTSASINSFGPVSDKSINSQPTIVSQGGPSGVRKPSVQRTNPANRNFEKRIVSKSAQKHGPKSSEKLPSAGQCENCKLLRSQNDALKKKIAEYETAFQVTNPLMISSDPIAKPSEQEVQALIRFIEFRFKAHHLTLSESEKYLLNSENITEEQLKKQLTVEQFLEIVVTQPFVVLNKRYIQVFLMKVCFTEELKKSSDKIKIDKETKLTKKQILENYKSLMSPFDLLPQAKEEEMFLQIAELVTSYYQQILAAMSNRKNGQGTISQKDLTEFFTEIQLEKEYIDFIITQIILESIDLEKLNYFAFFEIFYIPQEQGEVAQGAQGVKKIGGVQQPVDKKKRFQVDHVVKQEDEQYEESKSHVDLSRQKTLSKHGQESGDSYHNLNSDQSPNKRQEDEENYGQQEEQKYEEEYEQQKLQNKKTTPKLPQKPVVVQKQQKSPEKTKPVSKQAKKKPQKDDSYIDEFQEQNIEQEPAQKPKDKKKDIKSSKQVNQKKQPQKLVQKPYEIQDIEDQYKEEFQN